METPKIIEGLTILQKYRTEPDGYHIGAGKATDYIVTIGHSLIEIDGGVYEVDEKFFCEKCDGCGCRTCDFTGESSNVKKNRIDH